MERDWVASKSFLGGHAHICGTTYVFKFSSSSRGCRGALSGRMQFRISTCDASRSTAGGSRSAAGACQVLHFGLN